MSTLAEYLAYIARLKNDGRRLGRKPCPGCGEINHFVAPDAEDYVYDSVRVCPYCDHTFFAACDYKGTVTISNLGGDARE